jgi:putative Mg2+ transporter-C (MgtC) family protein
MEALDQLLRDAAAALGWPGEAMLRLLLAAAAGALVGLEREVRGRQAGFRTNLLVALGSALVMLVSIQMARIGWRPPAPLNITVDPARIAYGVMTGIGFLGAGAILKHGGWVRGLTTAAAMWCVAAIGLASGLGMYLLAIFATLVVLAALWVLTRCERLLPQHHVKRVTLRTLWTARCVTEAVDALASPDWHVGEVDFVRIGDLSAVEIHLLVNLSGHGGLCKLQERVQRHPELELVRVEAA